MVPGAKKVGIGDPGGLCTWTLTGPVEAVALWAMCQGAKETPPENLSGQALVMVLFTLE